MGAGTSPRPHRCRTRTTSTTPSPPPTTRPTAISSCTSAWTATPRTATPRSGSGSCATRSTSAAAASAAQHSVGDVLVQIDFENGGTDPIARVYEWDGSGIDLVSSGTTCAGIGGGDRCAISNTAHHLQRLAVRPEDRARTTTYAAGHFVEGGINLTDLGLDDGCFATFFAETRSSQSEDSTLSDYGFGSFPLCVTPDIATQVKNDQGQGSGAITINKGESVTDHVVVSGSKGVATGTVDMFVCGPTQSAQSCSSGGTQVGNDIPLVDGAADSESFTPDAIGWYCFRAEYTPAAGSKYLAASHTNSTSECVRVKPADVRIVKTPNDGTASAGEDISFTLQWGNVGEGKATGVVVTDDLPGDAGLDWSITGSTGTGSTCVDQRRGRQREARPATSARSRATPRPASTMSTTTRRTAAP